MKLKGSVKAIFPDAALIVFCLGILAACPIRVYQILKLIEPSTGFYSDTSNWSIITLYTILGICTAVILVFSYLSKNIPAAKLPEGRRIPLAVSGLILSAGFVTNIFDQVAKIKELASEAGVSASANLIEMIKTSGATLQAVDIVFAALSCIYMLVFSVSYIVSKKLYSKLKLLALSPLVWAITRVFFRVTKKISFIQVSDLILELAALIFVMIFFFTFARVASGINSEGSMWSVYACGISASLFILTYSIPRLMLFITGNSSLINPEAQFEFCDIGIAVFAVTLIVSTLRSGYPMISGEPDRHITVITADTALAADDENKADDNNTPAEKETNKEDNNEKFSDEPVSTKEE